ADLHLKPNHDDHFQKERKYVQDEAQARRGADTELSRQTADDLLRREPGNRPAAEEERRHDHADHGDFEELCGVEEPEAHPRILHVVPGDDFGFALRDVEGRPLVLRHDAGEEQDEAQGLEQNPPQREFHKGEPARESVHEAKASRKPKTRNVISCAWAISWSFKLLKHMNRPTRERPMVTS